uniref:Manganese/iron transport system ATP-binding protein n=1 Tax=Candidatus Kentrum sp. UNK TaxID=2126344 RepID=A0A451AZJ0_9GAMM|nr:MAG: manganese/iron transport system ATP-binding protein [Candidatus Kentron sp. UNK]VFK71327.1 MAG: manganese/iron transport system ATP-binding protein [Candidatus Kentron sp. UNK]
MKAIRNGVVELGNSRLDIPFMSLDSPCSYITGPNGVGKSTLLKVILGLVSLSAGERSEDAAAQYGYVPQHYRQALFPWLTARKNVLLYNKSDSVIEDLIDTGFAPRDLGKRPPRLSGGQCQRIAVVREACADFNRLVLDEPFSGIDIKTVPKLGRLLARAIDQGARVVVTSHTPLPKELVSIPGFRNIPIERVSDESAMVIWP